MYKQYDEFDRKLLENDFMKRHYESLPFIGEKYERASLSALNTYPCFMPFFFSSCAVRLRCDII